MREGIAGRVNFAWRCRFLSLSETLPPIDDMPSPFLQGEEQCACNSRQDLMHTSVSTYVSMQQ